MNDTLASRLPSFVLRPASCILHLAPCILHPRPLLILLSLTLIIPLAACGPTAVTPPTPITLRIAGSTSMLPLLSDLTAAYTEEYPHVHFAVEGGGSHVGLERLEGGEIDLAACSWLPSPEKDTPQPYVATSVAWDGIALIVHPDNPLDELTLLQVRDIYAGWRLDWQEVGGRAGDIIVISREDGSGTRAVFERRVMGEQPVTLTAIVMPSSAAVVSYVARHATAIGYVSMAYVNGQVVGWSGGQMVRWSGGQVVGWSDGQMVGWSGGQQKRPSDQGPTDQGPSDHQTNRPTDQPTIKVLRIEGAYPTPDTVRSGVYHLTRPLYLVTWGEPTGEVRAFIDFALSPAGQAIIGQRYGRVR